VDQHLQDQQGRRIEYLRLSITDRCGFQCTYCAPAPHADGEAFLSLAEITRLAALLGRLGIRRVRLTGGEPTLRADLVEIARAVRAAPGVAEVALTTNGQRLAGLAEGLAAAGVSAVNVSLDTLDPARLARISGRGADLGRVLDGIRAAARAGFAALKLNTVVLRGENDVEVADLVRFAWSVGAVPRFIEVMPFGEGEPMPTAAVKALLAAQGLTLQPDPTRGWGPAHHVRGRDLESGQEGLIGFIGAMSENFCASCNRARISSGGEFQACLGGHDRVPLAALMRQGASDALLATKVREALGRKDERHHMEAAGAKLVLLSMKGIGG
jgi:cyclic pyranopterin phosphate synthase